MSKPQISLEGIVLQLEKRLEVLKLRLRLPFRSPAGAGSLHSQRQSLTALGWRPTRSARFNFFQVERLYPNGGIVHDTGLYG